MSRRGLACLSYVLVVAIIERGLRCGKTARIRAGIDAELLMLRSRAANEDLDAEGRANIELRLKLLLAHARLRGWIVDKKQVAKLSASVRLDRAELEAITADLERLAPGATGQLERLGRTATQDELHAIAAGDSPANGAHNHIE